MKVLEQLEGMTRVIPKRKNSEGGWEEIPGRPAELRGYLYPESGADERGIWVQVPANLEPRELKERAREALADLERLKQGI